MSLGKGRNLANKGEEGKSGSTEPMNFDPTNRKAGSSGGAPGAVSRHSLPSNSTGVNSVPREGSEGSVGNDPFRS